MHSPLPAPDADTQQFGWEVSRLPVLVQIFLRVFFLNHMENFFTSEKDVHFYVP